MWLLTQWLLSIYDNVTGRSKRKSRLVNTYMNNLCSWITLFRWAGMDISLSIAYGNTQCRIRPSLLCNEWELYNVTLINFFRSVFHDDLVSSQNSWGGNQSNSKRNANLLQLQGTVTLVLVVVSSWTLHTVGKQLIRDPWEMLPPHRLF